MACIEWAERDRDRKVVAQILQQASLLNPAEVEAAMYRYMHLSSSQPRPHRRSPIPFTRLQYPISHQLAMTVGVELLTRAPAAQVQRAARKAGPRDPDYLRHITRHAVQIQSANGLRLRAAHPASHQPSFRIMNQTWRLRSDRWAREFPRSDKP
ncbi:hypothetical protein EJ06DRAFT_563563 [Trichodelitschia bisporula]|uniref:Uncharacterized protein n=1 Tax=Trichodelitschia bisporula TaxID=703511 RepID=A0A6G1HTV6_9PEZI|nr:hypothetical protein EJ06DRAFT_563563 [Trichodelitschia bisporula]